MDSKGRVISEKAAREALNGTFVFITAQVGFLHDPTTASILASQYSKDPVIYLKIGPVGPYWILVASDPKDTAYVLVPMAQKQCYELFKFSKKTGKLTSLSTKCEK